MKEIKTQGKFRKSKAYGLVGCLALFSVMVASPVINVKAEESNSNVSSTTTITGKGHLDTEPYTTTSYKEGMEISKDPGDKYGYFTDYKSKYLFKYQYFNEDGSITYKYFKTWTVTDSNGDPVRTYFPQGANDELPNISDLSSGIYGDKTRNYGDNEVTGTSSEDTNVLYAVNYTEIEPTLSETGETIPSTEIPKPDWEHSSVHGKRILYKGDKDKLVPRDKRVNFTFYNLGLKTKVEREKVENRPVRYIKNESLQPNEKNTIQEGKDKYKNTRIVYDYKDRKLTNEEYERIINVEKNIPTVENGQVKETRTITYEEAEEKVIEVGTPKPKTDITNLPSPIRYVKDGTKEKGLPNERIEGKTGKSTVITTYDVNPKTGDIIENVGEPVVENPTETIIKVPAKTKVELIKKDGKVIERTTTYDVNPENGNITETVTERIISDNNPEKPPVLEIPEYTDPIGTIPLNVNPNGEQTGEEDYLQPPTVEIETLKNIPDDVEKITTPYKVKYIGNYNKDFGDNTILVKGKNGIVTKTTSYTVDENGNVTSKVKEDVTNSINEEIEVGLKTKVEIVNEDGKRIERTTEYELDENTGKVTPKVSDKILDNIVPPVLDVPEYTGPLSTNTPVDENGNLILPPVVDELPEFNGGVNPIDSPVLEIPEYTGPISTNTPVDDNGDLILPPVVEKPEFNGGVNPIEPPVEEKPEYKLPDKPKEEPVKETPKEETKVEDKKEKELPNTNSTSVLASLVSSVIGTLGLGYKSKRRK